MSSPDRSVTIRLKVSMAEYEAAMDRAGAKVNVLAGEIEAAGRSASGLAKIEQASNRVADAQTRLGVRSRELAALRVQEEAATRKLAEAEDRLSKAGTDETEVAKATRARASAEKELATVATQRGDAESNLAKAERDLSSAQSRLVATTESVDAAEARLAKSSESLEQQTKRTTDTGINPMRDAIVTLGPAIVPVAGAAAGLGAGLVGMGAAGVLAYKGIHAEITHGTALGTRYSAGLQVIRGDLGQLEGTAARGVIGGFNKAVGDAHRLLPTLNHDIGSLSTELGDVADNTLAGVISGFHTFEPLIQHVSLYIDELSHRYADWTAGASGAKFGAGVGAEFDQVMPVIAGLIAALARLVAAFAPVGSNVVTVLGALASAINALPLPVLQALASTFVALYSANRVNTVLSGVSSRLSDISTNALSAESRFGSMSGKVADGAAAMSKAAASASVIGTLGLVVGEAGFAISGYLERSSAFTRVMDQATSTEQSFAAALRVSNGQLDSGVQSAVQYALQQDQIAGKAAKAGIGLAQLTRGVTGSQADFANLVNTWKASGNPSGDTLTALIMLTAQFKAAQAAEQKYLADQTRLATYQPAVWGAQKTTADSVAAVATRYHLTSDEVSNYASVLGITSEEVKNGQVTNQALADSVHVVARAYGSASLAQTEYLDAVKAFAASDGDAAARAALIGATLKAGNGDALSYAAAMSTAAVANQQFVTDLNQTRKTAQDAGQAFDAAAHGVVDLSTGTINYRNAAAGPLIRDLQTMQDAAMKAAQATYQHEVATKGGAAAASDAYEQYYAQTHGALVDEAKQLGISTTQAGKLADKYFGMPKDVKTQIRAIGTDPVVKILDRIGAMLARLTGQDWVSTLGVHDEASAKILSVQRLLSGLHDRQVTIHTVTTTADGRVHAGSATAAYASGGSVRDGWFTAGEQGWELGYKSGDRVEFFSHPQSRAMLPSGPSVPAYAAGTQGAFDGVTALGNTGTAASNKAAAAKSASGSSKADRAAKAAAKQAAAAAKRAAAAEAARQKAIVAIQFRVDNSDLPKLLTATKGTAAQIAAAMRTVIADVHAAALKGLGSDSVIPALRKQARELENYATSKARVASQLKAANAHLVDEEKLYADQWKTVAAAVMSSFDAGTAGNGTYASLMGALDDAVEQAAMFKTDIDHLTGKLNASALKQIEGEGPAQAGADLHALATASPAQVAAYNARYAQLQKLAQATGKSSADSLYKAGVDAAKGLVAGLQSQEAAIAKAMAKIAATLVAQIRKDLKINSPSRVMHELFAYAGEGGVTGIESKVEQARAAGRKFAAAAVTAPSMTSPALAHWTPAPAAPVVVAQPIDYARLASALADVLGDVEVSGVLRTDTAGLSAELSRADARKVVR